MKVGTFFSGVGSPEQALRNLDIKHEIEFACDIDKYAKQTYLKNFKPKLYAEDITSLDMQDLPYVDLLVFGFPCQAFSMAGKRKGFDDTRGTLFYDALRYLKEHRPRYFIAENVKGLLSHDNGKTFGTIIDCLAKTKNYQMSLMPFDNLGYHIHYKVLNTKDFGIPQNRERIFIIGIRDDEDNNFNFPKGIPLELKLKDVLQDNPDYFKLIDGFNSYDKIKYVDNEIVGTLTEHQSRSGITNGFKIETNFLNKVDEKYYLSEEQQERLVERTEVAIENVDELTCLDTGNAQAIELQRLEDVKLIATKRVNETPKEINEFLREHKNISIKEIADKLNIPKTQAEHYFRTDKYRTIPSVEIWNKLKELLNFDSRYDKQVCEIEQSEYTFESASRLYSAQGLGATLQTTENTLYLTQSCALRGRGRGEGYKQKLEIRKDEISNCLISDTSASMVMNNRIRRLTPIECERLQGFPDNFTEGVSDTQRYKQMGNTITVNVIQAIIKNLLK